MLQLCTQCESIYSDTNNPTAYKFAQGNSLQLHNYIQTMLIPIMLIVLLWSGSIPIPSRHTTRVPLSSVVTVTVAVDVMDVPVTTSVTVNWNWASENALPWSRGRRDREMFNDGMSHWCPLEGIVHVNITLFPGHGLSTLDCSWAPETERNSVNLS